MDFNNNSGESISNEVQLVVFNLEDEEYGADISDVREIIKMEEVTSIPGVPHYVEGIINLRGQLSTVIDLRKIFQLNDIVDQEDNRIIVVEYNDNVIGMVVDTVSEVLRINTKDIERTPDIITNKIDSKFIKGVGKLEDRLIILVDLGKVLSSKDIEGLSKITNDYQKLAITDDKEMKPKQLEMETEET